MSERMLLFKEMYDESLSKGLIPEGMSFLDFVKNKRLEISNLLSSEEGSKYVLGEYEQEFKGTMIKVKKIDRYSLIIDQREKLGFPKFISLDSFNSLTQLISLGGDSLDYDDFLRLMKQKDLSKASHVTPPKIDKLVKNQGSRLAQGIIELVSNAIDASIKGNSIGRFGKGFYQAMKFLDDEDSQLIVDTKKTGSKPFKIILRNRKDALQLNSSISDKKGHGTIVRLEKSLDDETVKYYQDYIYEVFSNNSYANIFLNGDKVNDLSGYVYINGHQLDVQGLPDIHITLDESGFEIMDHGKGMNSKIISEKLLYPKNSSNEKTNPSGDELERLAEENIKFFYKTGKSPNAKTVIKLQVSGVMIEEFHEDTIGDISEFTLEFPYFTWLPDARNKIIPTKEVVVAIKYAMKKIHNKTNDLDEKIKLIEIIGKVVNNLKNRKTDETENKYIIDCVAKDSFSELNRDLQQSGKAVLCGSPELMSILGNRDDLIFVSPDFVDLDLLKIPGIQRIKNIDTKSPFGYRFVDKKFLTVKFDENSNYDYLIFDDYILVNSDYINTKNHREIINILVNLLTSYEGTSKKYYYGKITDDMTLESVDNLNDFEFENEGEKESDIVSGLEHGEKQSSIESKNGTGTIDKPEYIVDKKTLQILNDIGKKYKQYILNVWYKQDDPRSKGGDDEFSLKRSIDTVIKSIISMIKKNESLRCLEYDDYLFLMVSGIFDKYSYSNGFDIGYLNCNFNFKDKFLEIFKNRSEKVVNSMIDMIWMIRELHMDGFSGGGIASYIDKVLELYAQEPDYMIKITERFMEDNGQTLAHIFMELTEVDDIDDDFEDGESLIFESLSFSGLIDMFRQNNMDLYSLGIPKETIDKYLDEIDLSKIHFMGTYSVRMFILGFITYLDRFGKDSLDKLFLDIYSLIDNYILLNDGIEIPSSMRNKARDGILQLLEKSGYSPFTDLTKSGSIDVFIACIVAFRQIMKAHNEVSMENAKNELYKKIENTNENENLDNREYSIVEIITKVASDIRNSEENSYDLYKSFGVSRVEFAEYMSRLDLSKIGVDEYDVQIMDFDVLSRPFVYSNETKILLGLSDYIENDINASNELDRIFLIIENMGIYKNFERPGSNFFSMEDGFERIKDIILNSGLGEYFKSNRLFTKDSVINNKTISNILYLLTIIYHIKRFKDNQNMLKNQKNGINWKNGMYLLKDYTDFHSKDGVGFIKNYLGFSDVQIQTAFAEIDWKAVINRDVSNKEIVSFINGYVEISDAFMGVLNVLFLMKEWALYDLQDIINMIKCGKYEEARALARDIVNSKSFQVNFQYTFGNDSIREKGRLVDSIMILLTVLNVLDKVNIRLEVTKFIDNKDLGIMGIRNSVKSFLLFCKENYKLPQFKVHDFQMCLRISDKGFEYLKKKISFIVDDNLLGQNQIGAIINKYADILDDYGALYNHSRFEEFKSKLIYEYEKLDKSYPLSNSRKMQGLADEYFSDLNDELLGLHFIYDFFELVLFNHYVQKAIDRNFDDDNVEINSEKDEFNNEENEKKIKGGFPLIDDSYKYRDYSIDYIRNVFSGVYEKNSLYEDKNYCGYNIYLNQIGLTVRGYGYLMNKIPEVISSIRGNNSFYEGFMVLGKDMYRVTHLLERLKEKDILKETINGIISLYEQLGTVSSLEMKSYLSFIAEVSGYEMKSEHAMILISTLYFQKALKGDFDGMDNLELEMLGDDSLRRDFMLNSILTPKYEKLLGYLLCDDFVGNNGIYDDIMFYHFIVNKSKGNPGLHDMIKKYKSLSLNTDPFNKDNSLLDVLKYIHSLDAHIQSLIYDFVYIQDYEDISGGYSSIYIKNLEKTLESLFPGFKLKNPGLVVKALFVQRLLKSIYEGVPVIPNDFNNINPLVDLDMESIKHEILLGYNGVNQSSSSIDSSETINQLDYPSDMVLFVTFLLNGGEFLKDEPSKVDFQTGSDFSLSQLMSVSRLNKDSLTKISSKSDVNKLIDVIKSKDYDYKIYQGEITSSIEGQDRSSMIWIRELVQNSRDAINKTDGEMSVDIDFYMNDGHWTSSVYDTVGMDLFEVFNYLLLIGDSGKTAGDGATGMFGQGFYTCAVGAKELRIKTSKGDGKTVYLKMVPIYNSQDIIIDFQIDYDVIDEDFKGTMIERVDKATGIVGNLKALIGVNNIQKYVGNVRDIEILYKGKKVNESEKNSVVGKMSVEGLGELELIKSHDSIERLSKDDLYISEIPEDFLQDFPDRIVKFVRSQKYSLNLPSKIQLNMVRNSITDYEANLDILRPYIFRLIIQEVLKAHVNHGLNIPMLPLDYFSNKNYNFRYDYKAQDYAEYFNEGDLLTQKQLDYINADNINIMSFLIYVKFDHAGEETSLFDIRQKVISKHNEVRNKRYGKDFQDTLDISTEIVERSDQLRVKYNLTTKEVAESLNITQKKLKTFISKIKKMFSPVINEYFGGKFNIGFCQAGMSFSADSYSTKGYGMSFNIDEVSFKQMIDDVVDRDDNYKMIEMVSHEMTHNLEGDKRGTHENDMNHSKSFLKIHRDLLTFLLRYDGE